MAVYSIKRGLNIPISGAATGAPESLKTPSTVAYDPREFRGLVPKLAARPGDRVKRGSPLFYSKTHPEIQFLSPASGTVKEVIRGKRRVITAIVVSVDGDESESFPTWSTTDVANKTREEVAKALMWGGLWATLRTRPLNEVASPEVTPQAIFICGTETGPCQPGADALMGSGDKDAVQMGISALSKLTEGDIHFTTLMGSSHPAFQGLTGVSLHQFSGPHPAGDATVQINHIGPPRGTGQVWYVSAWDVARIGELLLTGSFPNERVYAAVGAGCKTPRFVKTLLGAPISDVVGEVTDGEHRYIRGSVLTGTTTASDQWCGFLNAAIHVLPAAVPRQLFGWMRPRLGTWSAHRAFLSGFLPSSRPKDMRPGVYGGFRGQVPVGAYTRVVASPDMYPTFLMRALAAEDLVESIQLGMLELSEEEAALCTYICPSKVELDVLLQQGLDRYRQEA